MIKRLKILHLNFSYRYMDILPQIYYIYYNVVLHNTTNYKICFNSILLMFIFQSMLNSISFVRPVETSPRPQSLFVITHRPIPLSSKTLTCSFYLFHF